MSDSEDVTGLFEYWRLGRDAPKVTVNLPDGPCCDYHERILSGLPLVPGKWYWVCAKPGPILIEDYP